MDWEEIEELFDNDLDESKSQGWSAMQTMYNIIIQPKDGGKRKEHVKCCIRNQKKQERNGGIDNDKT